MSERKSLQQLADELRDQHWQVETHEIEAVIATAVQQHGDKLSAAVTKVIEKETLLHVAVLLEELRYESRLFICDGHFELLYGDSGRLVITFDELVGDDEDAGDASGATTVEALEITERYVEALLALVRLRLNAAREVPR